MKGSKGDQTLMLLDPLDMELLPYNAISVGVGSQIFSVSFSFKLPRGRIPKQEPISHLPPIPHVNKGQSSPNPETTPKQNP